MSLSFSIELPHTLSQRWIKYTFMTLMILRAHFFPFELGIVHRRRVVLRVLSIAYACAIIQIKYHNENIELSKYIVLRMRVCGVRSTFCVWAHHQSPYIHKHTHSLTKCVFFEIDFIEVESRDFFVWHCAQNARSTLFCFVYFVADAAKMMFSSFAKNFVVQQRGIPKYRAQCTFIDRCERVSLFTSYYG